MNLSLLLRFVRQELLDRHARSALGLTWLFLLPLAQILIFTLVFSNVMGMRLQGMGMENLGPYSYSIYLVIGLLAWFAFANTVNKMTSVYQDKAGLLNKVHLPLAWLPLYIPITETLLYLLSMTFFVVFLIVIGFEFTLYWLWLPLIYAQLILFAYALGYLLSIISVFIKDIKEAVNLFLQLGFWMTPIVYVLDLIPAKWHFLFQLNPIYSFVQALRAALMQGQHPNFTQLAFWSCLSLLLLATAIYLGRRLEKDLRDFI